jgi:hypothetical protein
MTAPSDLKERVSAAIWEVMRAHDGTLLTGDFRPSHDQIVEAVMAALVAKENDRG